MTMIEAALKENRQFPPPADFSQSANISPQIYQNLDTLAYKDFLAYWGKHAREQINWHKPFTCTLNETNAPFFRWLRQFGISEELEVSLAKV